TAGAVATTFGGVADGFVAVLDPSGSTLVDSVFVGGDGNEQIDSIVTNGDGSVIGTGVTDSTAFAPCAAAGSHPFFVRLADGALTATAIGCDGETLASCFAAGSPSGDGSFVALTGSGSPLDVRVLSFDANGAVVHDTTFGGSGQDYPDAVAVGT